MVRIALNLEQSLVLSRYFDQKWSNTKLQTLLIACSQWIRYKSPKRLQANHQLKLIFIGAETFDWWTRFTWVMYYDLPKRIAWIIISTIFVITHWYAPHQRLFIQILFVTFSWLAHQEYADTNSIYVRSENKSTYKILIWHHATLTGRHLHGTHTKTFIAQWISFVILNISDNPPK